MGCHSKGVKRKGMNEPSVTSCSRCKQNCDPAELRSPPALLRALATPFFGLFIRRSPELRSELVAGYCHSCGRQVNACLFFAAFMVVMFVIALTVVSIARMLGWR
jgi:hypothetical protein